MAKFSTERYQRQLILNRFGAAAQQKLTDTSVLVVGAGGLGCPVLTYLAAAGIGRIGIIDHDTVAIHNLHRQPLYTVEDIGKLKAVCAGASLNKLNDEIVVEVFTERLSEINCISYFNRFDIIIDGSDNFASRYMINDAAVLTGKPLIYGAVSQYEGQVAIFNVTDPSIGLRVNYRDLFPQPPAPGEILSCEEAGVLGVLPGLIGTMMAAELIKLTTGIGQALINRLMTVNILTNQFMELELTASKNSKSLIPKDAESFARFRYEEVCNNSGFDISPEKLLQLLENDEVTLVDVREEGEMPLLTGLDHQRVPLSVLESSLISLPSSGIAFLCQSGIRSRRAAEMLAAFRKSRTGIYSVTGGIAQWSDYKKSLEHA